MSRSLPDPRVPSRPARVERLTGRLPPSAGPPIRACPEGSDRAAGRHGQFAAVRDLPDDELVALALGCSPHLAGEILARVPVDSIRRSPATGVAVDRLNACVEIGHRSRRAAGKQPRAFSSSRQIARAFIPRLGDALDEEFWCIYLDSRNVPIEDRLIARGAPNGVAVDLRAILAQALRIGAVSIAVVHNHPSRDPAPSGQDISLTEAIHKACETVDLRLLDHVIVAGPSHFSFVDAGLLPGSPADPPLELPF